MKKPSKEAIEDVLNRGVEEVIDRAGLEERLMSGKKLRIKLGIDPTSQNIHIGRAVALWKLRALQDLGHQVVFIVGDFTGLIGDTSDKDSERPMLTQAQVKANMKGYIKQVQKILDPKKMEVHYNSKWLKKLGYLEIAEQANEFSLHEFEARENIARRMKDQKRVSLREILYPLMQGYDSVAIKADVEVGGNDQKFNLLAGRTLQRVYKQKPQDIMMFTLLEGTDGRKMSSSWGNVINIMDEPNDMFGKTMSILDELIVKYFELCTRLPLSEVRALEKGLKDGSVHPREAKARLAREIVFLYHGAKAADAAVAEFDKVHKNKETPDDIEEFRISGRSVVGILVGIGAAKSNSEAKRLLQQGGVKVDGVVVTDPERHVQAGSLVQVGKRRFARIVSFFD
jgi:tyrosyl-tRNA synthetase